MGEWSRKLQGTRLAALALKLVDAITVGDKMAGHRIVALSLVSSLDPALSNSLGT